MAVSIFLHKRSIGDVEYLQISASSWGPLVRWRDRPPFSLEQSELLFSLPSPDHKAVTLSCQSSPQIPLVSLLACLWATEDTDWAHREDESRGSWVCWELYLTWMETQGCNMKSPTEDNKILSLYRGGVRKGFCMSVLSSLVFLNIYYAILL